jgi:hypothetical protein
LCVAEQSRAESERGGAADQHESAVGTRGPVPAAPGGPAHAPRPLSRAERRLAGGGRPARGRRRPPHQAADERVHGVVARPAAPHVARAPQDAQLRDQQAPRLRVETAQRGRETALHRRSETPQVGIAPLLFFKLHFLMENWDTSGFLNNPFGLKLNSICM